MYQNKNYPQNYSMPTENWQILPNNNVGQQSSQYHNISYGQMPYPQYPPPNQFYSQPYSMRTSPTRPEPPVAELAAAQRGFARFFSPTEKKAPKPNQPTRSTYASPVTKEEVGRKRRRPEDDEKKAPKTASERSITDWVTTPEGITDIIGNVSKYSKAAENALPVIQKYGTQLTQGLPSALRFIEGFTKKDTDPKPAPNPTSTTFEQNPTISPFAEPTPKPGTYRPQKNNSGARLFF
ncbi:MAG: hypothetical protein ACRCWQ_13240 [Bacilli bacterium]